MVNHTRMRKLVESAVRQHPVSKWREEFGYSAKFIYDVLSGKAPVSANLAARLGYKKIEQEPMFEKIKESK